MFISIVTTRVMLIMKMMMIKLMTIMMMMIDDAPYLYNDVDDCHDDDVDDKDDKDDEDRRQWWTWPITKTMLFIFTTTILLMTVIDEWESFIINKYFILFLIYYFVFLYIIYPQGQSDKKIEKTKVRSRTASMQKQPPPNCHSSANSKKQVYV